PVLSGLPVTGPADLRSFRTTSAAPAAAADAVLGAALGLARGPGPGGGGVAPGATRAAPTAARSIRHITATVTARRETGLKRPRNPEDVGAPRKCNDKADSHSTEMLSQWPISTYQYHREVTEPVRGATREGAE
ncbi:hypothetical protein K7G98_27060, partial [Saccharothrix sp. MB29]|nr:hypothetical protein [Saccharothrix sp. MB29]